MTITLDDMSCLLHLPVTGRPIDHVPSTFTREIVKVLLMTRLTIPIEEKAIGATTVGAKVSLTWLVNLYHL